MIESTNEEIQNTYKLKDETREAYFKALYDYEKQNDKIKWIRGLRNQKRRLEEDNKDREERIAKKR